MPTKQNRTLCTKYEVIRTVVIPVYVYHGIPMFTYVLLRYVEDLSPATSRLAALGPGGTIFLLKTSIKSNTVRCSFVSYFVYV